MAATYSVHVRCECRGGDGRQLGTACPRLHRADGSWNPRHGSAGYTMRIPAGDRVIRFKRDGFASKAAARGQAARVAELLHLAGDDITLITEIGELAVEATRHGGELPDLAEVKAKLTAGSPLSGTLTFGQAWLEYLAAKKGLRPSSRESLEDMGILWFAPVLEKVPLHRLGVSHCAAVFERIEQINEILIERREAGDRSFTPVEGDLRVRPQPIGVNRMHRIYDGLRAFCNYEMRRTRRLAFNPVYAIELPPAGEYEADVWGPEEVEALLAYAADHEPQLAIGYRLALKFGLRRGEIVAMPIASVRDDILVTTSAVLAGADVVVGKPKSRAGDRSIPADADPDFAAALRAHRRAQATARLAAGTAWRETGLLITDATGQMLKPWILTNSFRELSRELGFPLIRLHGGRHTANSLWREAGIDARVRQEWLGHSTQTLTERTYNHVRPAAHTAAAALAASFWRGGRGTDVT